MRGLGATVRRARELVSLTQGELAARTGISQGSISRLECGRGISTPLRCVMSVLAVLGAQIKTLPPETVPDDVLWLMGIPQLAPWSSPPDTPPAAVDPSLKALIERHRAMTPAERILFVRAALTIADAMQAATGASPRDGAR